MKVKLETAQDWHPSSKEESLWTAPGGSSQLHPALHMSHHRLIRRLFCAVQVFAEINHRILEPFAAVRLFRIDFIQIQRFGIRITGGLGRFAGGDGDAHTQCGWIHPFPTGSRLAAWE
jgi:hypothetical protein